MYKRVNYLIKVKGGYFHQFLVHSALNEGAMSPLLFNIFVDDIRHIFDKECDPVIDLGIPLSRILYADDLAMISTSKQGLTTCLSKLEMYCQKWQLEVNTKKSEIILFNAEQQMRIFILMGHV